MEWIQKSPKMEFDEWDSIESKLAKINGIKDLKNWLNPKKEVLYSPYLLDNIECAVGRIIKALGNFEQIGILYDADTDGLTSGTIMARYLNHFTDNIQVLYGQRTDGHGLENLVEIIPKDLDLLIIVDSSTNSVKACQFLKENYDIDIVIFDHHIKEVENPFATVVNNQVGNYPNRELSGVGVTWKALQVMDDKLSCNYANDYIDLVGLGIYADLMSVKVMENRYLINESFNNVRNLGLKTLIFENGDISHIDSTVYGYNIVPLINASARMNKIEIVVKLLLSDDEFECKQLVKEIVKLNKSRKTKQGELLEGIKDLINPKEKIIVVVTDNPLSGFTGLIASNVVSQYKKPCLVFQKDEDDCYFGSGRSYDNFPLKDFLGKSKLFDHIQGHEGSFGVRIKEENILKLREYIEKFKDDSQKNEGVFYDLELYPEDINTNFIERVRDFNAISGRDFPTTKFVIRDFIVWERSVLGVNKNTVKLTGDNNLTAIKFNVDSHYLEDIEFSKVDILGTLNINQFYNFRKKEMVITNQVLVEDIRIK